MANSKKPGENTGRDGGIYREVGPRGGARDNWATVPDNRPLPPTSKPGHSWEIIDRTPDSNR
ncbi:YjzC family protein [Marinobacter sp.]|uniref:YjzC family protein n=1 Tax=Marinobacter sp. TaxID=50741 RepID=UPI003A94F137